MDMYRWCSQMYASFTALQNLFIMAGANALTAQGFELPPPPACPAALGGLVDIAV